MKKQLTISQKYEYKTCIKIIYTCIQLENCEKKTGTIRSEFHRRDVIKKYLQVSISTYPLYSTAICLHLHFLYKLVPTAISTLVLSDKSSSSNIAYQVSIIRQSSGILPQRTFSCT